MVLQRIFEDETGLVNTQVYWKFFRVPAILAWVLAQCLWGSVLTVWYCLSSLDPWSRVLLELLYVIVAWQSIPMLQNASKLIMAGERMWQWGKTRFWNRQHLFNWIERIGQQDFNLVVKMDDEVIAHEPVFRMMRL